MKDGPIWQAQAVKLLSQFFEQDPDTKAVTLSGSLATSEAEADAWSDVAAKIILADHALDRYSISTNWLSPFGRLIGVERDEDHLAKTLRVCLEDFHRFDLTFISESALEEQSVRRDHLFPPPYAIVWSKLPDLETRIASISLPAEYQDISQEGMERMANEFWFKASIAIAKVVRNDSVIGMHLTLDLARDGLVIQMIRRDREKITTIHRTGGWGNELLTHFSWNNDNDTGEEILNLVKSSCEVFDELASALLPGYQHRGPLLFPIIERAKQVCHNRAQAG